MMLSSAPTIKVLCAGRGVLFMCVFVAALSLLYKNHTLYTCPSCKVNIDTQLLYRKKKTYALRIIENSFQKLIKKRRYECGSTLMCGASAYKIQT